MFKDKEKFFAVKGWRRLVHEDKVSRMSSILGAIFGVFSIIISAMNALPELKKLLASVLATIKNIFNVSELFISKAWAQSGSTVVTQPFDPKPIIILGIFGVLFVGFFCVFM